MSILTRARIRHTVVFALSHPAGSDEERDFLDALAGLAAIDGVEECEVVAEISPKNAFTHAVSMEFADRAAYDAYNGHPDHVGFVQGRWLPEVADFLEIDLTAPDGADRPSTNPR